MTILNTILNILFPVRCIVCGKDNLDICNKCISSFENCNRENQDWIFSIFDYRNPYIKKSISLLKYKGRKNFAKIFANILHDRILEELSDLKTMENFDNPILIPIPITNKRIRERGFNQSELLCEELIKLNKNNDFIIEKKILKKIKDTKNQAQIKERSARLTNLLNSFSVENKEKILKRNIILIDDVTTTGATLLEAKRILKKNRAKKIIAFTIAH